MKITMYELLGMIKDGKAPKKIKVTGNIYEYDEEFKFYLTQTKDGRVCLGGLLNEANLLVNCFNEYEVEILEEEKKIPERVLNAEVFDIPKLNNMELSNIALTNKEDIKIIKDTLNKVLEHLKSKGDDKK